MNKQEVINHALTIQGWMSPTDLDVLYDLAMQYVHPGPGGYAVEVGCWKGESTYVLASVCKEKNAVLYAVDTWAGVPQVDSYKNKPDNIGSYIEAVQDPERFYQQFLANVAGLPVVPLRGDSSVMHAFVPDRGCAFCFLDGNHNSPWVDWDIAFYQDKVAIGGIISGHDHGNPEGDVHWAVERAFGNDWKIQVRPGVCTTIWVHEVKG